MPNAASELVALLETWGPLTGGRAAEGIRRAAGTSELTFWRQQAHAVQLLTTVEQHLAGMAAYGVQPLVSEQVGAIVTVLDAAEAEIRAAEDVDDGVRRYLLGLVAEAERCVTDWLEFGAEAARQATLTLGGALYTLAEITAEPAAKTRRFGLARSVAVQAMSGAVAQQMLTTGADLGQRLLD